MLDHKGVTPSIKFAGSHLYNRVERGTARVKSPAMTLERLERGLLDPESSELIIRLPSYSLYEALLTKCLKSSFCGPVSIIPLYVSYPGNYHTLNNRPVYIYTRMYSHRHQCRSSILCSHSKMGNYSKCGSSSARCMYLDYEKNK